MINTLDFFVHGRAVPGGSKTAFLNRKTGRAMIVDAAGAPNKVWRQEVAAVARQHYQEPLEFGAVSLELHFFLARPKGHFGTGKKAGILKASAARYILKKPDTLKLARAVEDALTGIVWHDDSQIVRNDSWKHWADTQPGVQVIIRFLERTKNESEA